MGVIRASRARMARMYSTPRLLLALRSSDALSGPASASTAAWRQAANGLPCSSRTRRAAGYSGASRQAAARCSASTSPHSLPKDSTSTTPVAARTSTPPRANVSAEAAAQGVGSSSTRSAPPIRASRAGSICPRWRSRPAESSVRS